MKRSTVMSIIGSVALFGGALQAQGKPGLGLLPFTNIATGMRYAVMEGSTRAATSKEETVHHGGESVTYEEMVESVKRDPESVDFREFRMAYSRSAMYDPYPPHSYINEIERLLIDEDVNGHGKALQLIQERLERRYADVEVHNYAALVYDRLGRTAERDHHLLCWHRIIGSILSPGIGKEDGATYATAWRVVLTMEEYAVMEVLDFVPESQELNEVDGHRYDVFEVKDATTGQPGRLHFNVDPLMAWSGWRAKE